MNVSKEIPKNLPIFMVVKDENSQYTIYALQISTTYIYIHNIYIYRRRYYCMVYISILTPLVHRSSTTTNRNRERIIPSPFASKLAASFSLQEREEKLAAESTAQQEVLLEGSFFISVRIIGCFQK